MSNSTPSDESEASRYPFGLSSKPFFVIVVVVGLIGPGLLVYTLEQANLSGIADLVWFIGYGTTVFVVWYIWLRPVDFVGQAAQNLSSESKTEREDDGGGPDPESHPSSEEDAEPLEETGSGDGSGPEEQSNDSSVTEGNLPQESAREDE